MIRKILQRITRNRPMKSIDLNGMPYLERYYMFGLFGYQVWLHRFLTADSERHLHSHPWTALSIVLAGRYVESYRDKHGRLKSRCRTAFGKHLKISPGHIHRIMYAEPGTWTLMIVGRKREPAWFFLDAHGNRVEMKTSPAEWWRNAGVRNG